MTQDSEGIARTIAQAGQGRGRRLALLAVALLLAAAVGWYLYARLGAAGSVTYETEAVTRGDVIVTVTATGTVQPTTQVEVSSELSGTLSSVDVDYNDPVEVGQVLARLDDTKLRAQVANARASLAAAEARVAAAEASASEAEANYESQKELDRRGLSTHREIVTYSAAHARAQAEVQIARADQSLAEANLNLQAADLEKATIRSPIKGIVLDRAAEAGQIVASSLNAPVLFTLAEDLSRMELRVDIDEADIGRVAVGNRASFTVDAYSGRGFPATITSVRYAPETTEGVVTYKAVLSVANDEGLLRPGMTATAAIVVDEVRDALVVPNAALRYTPPQTAKSTGRSGGGLIGLIMPRRPETPVAQGEAGRTLWILRNGTPEMVAVTPGATDGRHTVIVAGEVAAGDLVITDQGEAD